MDDPGTDPTSSLTTLSYHDTELHDRKQRYLTQLRDEVTNLRLLIPVQPPELATMFKEMLDPARLDRMSTAMALKEYLEVVHSLYFSVDKGQCRELVDTLCARIEERKRRGLCQACRETAERVSGLLLGLDGDRAERPEFDDFWPPRPRERSHYFDGSRIIPPEDIDADENLPPNVILHHRSARELVMAAESCPFCELLRVACILDSFREREKPYDHSREPLSRVLRGVCGRSRSGLFDRIAEQFSKSEEPVYLKLNKEREPINPQTDKPTFVLGHFYALWKRPATALAKEERKVVYTRLQVYQSIDTAPNLAPYISQRVPLQSSESPAAFSLIETWFQRCRGNHHECRKTISGELLHAHELHKLPRRLLDIGASGDDSPELRLVDTSGFPEGHWIALSHCWGDPQHHPLKTTRANLDEHTRGIPLSSMPKTFADAITITRFLGIRYIWIDSLCIVQDDQDEWLTESKDMGTVYERAVLTLAASSAANSTEGLFLSRAYSGLKVPCVRLPMTRKETTGSKEHLGDYNVGLEWRQEPFMKPLDPMITALSERGWATQEWILSRRTLHFLNSGLVWICRSFAEDESGHFLVGRNLPQKDWDSEWARIIQEHSVRKFTHQSDRLVSLEGLARKFKKLKPDSSFYAFGIWESDMPLHLFWGPKFFGKRLDSLPSWSWASCPYEIWFRFRDVSARKDYLHYWAIGKVVGLDKHRLSLKAQVVEMSQFLGKQFEPGDGFASIQGRANDWHGRYVSIADGAPCGWAMFDDGRGGPIAATQPVFFLCLATVLFYIDPLIEWYGLLAIKDPAGSDCFIRVGVAAVSVGDWFKGKPLVDVDLI